MEETKDSDNSKSIDAPEEKKKQENKENQENKDIASEKSSEKTGSDAKITKLLIALLGVLVIILLVNIYINANIANNLEKAKIQSAKADAELIVIKDISCEKCYDAQDVIDNAKADPRLNVLSERAIEFGSEEANVAIEEYGIKRLPAVIIKGNVSSIEIEGFSPAEGALVYSALTPPFIDASDGSVKGIVDMTIIRDASCKECFDYGFLSKVFEQEGIELGNYSLIDYSSLDAKSLIAKYNIDAVPSIILSEDIGYYEGFEEFFEGLATKENDGNYVIKVRNPPYLNLSNSQIMGKVSLTYISDASCTECYNVTLHRSILDDPTALGMFIENEAFVDVSSGNGRALLAKYNITTVPSVIVSEEAAYYPSFEEGWEKLGTKEKDGRYVFRNNELLEGLSYKDLITGEIKGAKKADDS